MIKKLFFLVAITLGSASCSSDTTDNNQEGGVVTEPVIAMITRVDGLIYETPPQGGGNNAEASGGIYGNTYFLLKGYKNFGVGKGISTNKLIGNKIYDIKIAIPKNDVTVGIHSFNSTIATGGYYADLDISGVIPIEDVNTTSGEVNITNYNAATKVVKGNFNFTTNNGVNPTVTSHTLIGSFNYVLN
jgi:hypothetical protein